MRNARVIEQEIERVLDRYLDVDRRRKPVGAGAPAGGLARRRANADLPGIDGILAVIGYSLNDTIVVFDRVRENFRKIRKKSAEEITNISINQTISRTLKTSLTTLLVLASLYLLGGEVIHAFALALIIGVIVGTYSSIYVATSTALALGISRKDLMLPEKDDQELARP